MNKEDKELLFRDLCNRLPYNVMCQVDFKEDGKYNSKVMLLSGIFTDEAYFTTKGGSIYSNEYKPYLFPLSSMTEEQKKEYNYWKHEVPVCRYEYGDVVEEIELYDSPESFEYLIENHFDYRGLIPMGLAEDATDKNIYDYL